MRVVCSKCGYQFDSVILDQRTAFQELENKYNHHIKTKHLEQFNAASVAIAAVTVAIARKCYYEEFLVVPEDQKFINELMDTDMETIMTALGYEEPEEEMEEEEEESELERGTIELPSDDTSENDE